MVGITRSELMSFQLTGGHVCHAPAHRGGLAEENGGGPLVPLELVDHVVEPRPRKRLSGWKGAC